MSEFSLEDPFNRSDRFGADFQNVNDVVEVHSDSITLLLTDGTIFDIKYDNIEFLDRIDPGKNLSSLVKGMTSNINMSDILRLI